MAATIRIGDVLRLKETEITIKDIYLFKSFNGKYKGVVKYDHKDLQTGTVVPDEIDTSLDFEGWEKI